MDDIRNYVLTLRKDFCGKPLDENHVDPDAIKQFEHWFKEAIESQVHEPNAMTLCTSSNNIPSARIVLLRDFAETGFTFFTNYKSRKGNDMEQSPAVCLNFFWPELERQVRIRGTASKVSERISDDYFASRPRLSQLGAWASAQSSKVNGRSELDRLYAEVEKKFEGKDVPRPPHWGGYNVVPEAIEFWQGRPNRFHDRILFEKDEKRGWKISRLAP